MTKSLCLTTPVVAPNESTVLAPTAEWMHLAGTHTDLLYGFHGSTTSKQPFLSAAYDAADKKGKLTKRELTFYLIDLTYRAPESAESQSLLYGQLPPHLLDKTPFIVSRRLSTETAHDLGLMWQEEARDLFGLRKLKAANVNWSQPSSYMLEFPEVAAQIFKRLPLLKCMLMPMRMTTMSAGSDICLVGVAPKAEAKGVKADVRYKPDVKVDLSFA
ncbi:MAG: hypothetical protein K2X55_24935 [Burkholderiaceae bacterium]|nr:hypothetical protein [Burkholderiaceae bacterium]